MTVPELELGLRTRHFVPKKGKSRILVFFGTYRGVANAGRSIILHMQATNACKLEHEEASSSVQTKWQTES